MSDPTPEIQRYLNRPLDDLLDELTLHREQATGGAERGPAEVWQKLAPELRQRVCAEWNWCGRRQDARFDDPMTLASLLISIVAPDALKWQVPAALIAVILIKRGLDAFCECSPIGAKES